MASMNRSVSPLVLFIMTLAFFIHMKLELKRLPLPRQPANLLSQPKNAELLRDRTNNTFLAKVGELIPPVTNSNDSYIEGSSAFCLLIKDDNDILPEWIAYHYHVFNMRRLIVAVDPTSKTSPLEVLEPWSKDLGHFDLNFNLWSDNNYTPTHFHGPQKDYSKIPFTLTPNQVKFVESGKPVNCSDIFSRTILSTTWHGNATGKQEEVRHDILLMNLYTLRQRMFVSACSRQIKNEQQSNPSQPSWVVHTDTDEFLVPNPWITSYMRSEDNGEENNEYTRKDLLNLFPESATAGSLWILFKQFLEHKPSASRVGPSCVMIPRILFGSKEDDNYDNITTGNVTWNHSKFQSLRWKYHVDYQHFNHRPKALLDITQLHYDDEFFHKGLAKSIHQPLQQWLGDGRPGCSDGMKSLPPDNDLKFFQPIAIHHILGSLERYNARDTVWRSASAHKNLDKTANYAKGDENIEYSDKANDDFSWWIGGWFDSFVEMYGTESVLMVLSALKHEV